MNLSEKVILVTGGSKGIGRGIAEHLAQLGYQVVLTSRKQASAQATADAVNKKNQGNAIGLEFDIDQPDAPEKLLAMIKAKYGRLDGLINNAVSKSLLADVVNSPDQVLDFAITTNLGSLIKLCKYSHPYLKATKGCIVNITSSITKRYISGLPLYAMTKAAIVKLTEALGADWAKDGIRVNAINPGFTRSSAFSDMGLQPAQVNFMYQYFSEFQPLGIAEPYDIAPMIAMLLSEQARMITGAIIDIDGGHHIQGHNAMPPAG
jgi:NAD(P)-dependent dehydrogenase (short-subunit alcohol dehydrogenase family)